MATGERVELHTDVPTAAWPEFLGTRRLQSAGDLGNRMLTALAGAGEPCMILGSDAPGLPLAYLKRLLAAASDVALGPADDGGYYAILAHRTHPAMFAGVEWSTAQTLAQTRAAVEQCGLSIELGDPWFDVDTPDDFTRLLQSPTLPPHTANFLRRSAPRGI